MNIKDYIKTIINEHGGYVFIEKDGKLYAHKAQFYKPSSTSNTTLVHVTRIQETVQYEQFGTVALVIPAGVIPEPKNRMLTAVRQNGKIKLLGEYIIEQVQEIIYHGELIAFIIYANNQEVRRYVES